MSIQFYHVQLCIQRHFWVLIVPGEQDTEANVSLTATLDRFAMDPNLSFVRKAHLVTTDTGHSVTNNRIVKVTSSRFRLFQCSIYTEIDYQEKHKEKKNFNKQ